MYKCKKDKIIPSIILLLCVLYSSYSYGQTLQKPTLSFTNSACARAGSNNFSVEFDFSGVAFDPNNIFTVQLSDPNGDFGTPVNLGSITGENDTFLGIRRNFALPTDTYGFNYRIRIVSSLPAMQGPPSDSFQAFFTTSERLVLNNLENVVLCGGPQTVSVNEIDPIFTYLWFRIESTGDVLIPGQNGSSLEISRAGRYYAAINYGACSQSGSGVRSNIITVTESTPGSLTIGGPNTVQICANETYELVASIDDRTYTYKWFKDNTEITGLAAYMPRYTIPNSNQFGVYRVEITKGGCPARSQDVTIEQRAGANFTVSTENPLIRVRLPRETINLTITHTSSSATITWFRNNMALPSSNATTRNAVEAGTYFAEVVDNSTSCPTAVRSMEYVVLDVVSIKPTIRAASDYTDCRNSNTTLSLVGVTATATDGNDYDLTSEQIKTLGLQWFKDGAAVNNATLEQLAIGSYNDNGRYHLNATISATMNFDSDPLNILLTLTGVEIRSSSASNALCPGETITFNVDLVTGFTYKWFKDGTEITVADPRTLVVSEIGTYNVTFEGFGCLNTTPEVNVVAFDDSVLTVSPSSTAILNPGETITLEASGADSYEWFDAGGNLLSSNETLNVNALGVYTVRGTVGGCRAQREINVVEDDGKQIIPNIVTPFNGDGINDKWELPNRFAFQSNVQVIIYNSRGKEVLNTTDYQNNWPIDNNLRDGMLFYFRVIKDNNLIKAGTISILQ